MEIETFMGNMVLNGLPEGLQKEIINREYALRHNNIKLAQFFLYFLQKIVIVTASVIVSVVLINSIGQ